MTGTDKTENPPKKISLKISAISKNKENDIKKEDSISVQNLESVEKKEIEVNEENTKEEVISNEEILKNSEDNLEEVSLKGEEIKEDLELKQNDEINEIEEIKEEKQNSTSEKTEEEDGEKQEEEKNKEEQKKEEEKKKKKINTLKIKKFSDATKAIKFYIAVEEWENAYTAIEEIGNKEKKALDDLSSSIDREIISGISEKDKRIKEAEKEKQKKTYESRKQELAKLKELTEKKEKKVQEKLNKERFKVRFSKIKEEINFLTKTNKNNEALNLLGKFLEENKDSTSVIRFYNHEKRKIIKNIEKQKKTEEEKLKKDAKLEALQLIGEKEEEKKSVKKEKKEKTPIEFIANLKDKLNFYKKIKEKLRKKRLLDEVSILIEEDSKAKIDMAEKKLENIHKGLIKELSTDKMLGYELYGKILGADKISGDTFGFTESKDKYNFFLGDATGHGIRAGFIVTLLSRIFNKYVEKLPLRDLAFEINNGLKQDLKNRNFITGIFFEIKKTDIKKVDYIGMGHEPMLVYKEAERKVEKLIAGGLAAGIRIIKEREALKEKTIEMEDSDIVLIYSDGTVETKNTLGEFYGLERLSETFQRIAKIEKNLTKIYDYIIKDLKTFKSGTSFSDDTTILILRRNENKDIINKEDMYLKDLSIKEGLNKSEIKRLEGKTKDEIQEELEKIKKQKELKSILKNLEGLYYTGEILKLKQEAIRFIKEGYIDKKINFYLKKAIANETKYKIEQKNQKMVSKYNVLKELYEKGDYTTVIKECEDIIGKDGVI